MIAYHSTFLQSQICYLHQTLTLLLGVHEKSYFTILIKFFPGVTTDDCLLHIFLLHKRHLLPSQLKICTVWHILFLVCIYLSNTQMKHFYISLTSFNHLSVQGRANCCCSWKKDIISIKKPVDNNTALALSFVKRAFKQLQILMNKEAENRMLQFNKQSQFGGVYLASSSSQHQFQ